jgi:tRNA(His) guanylyltransferase
MTDSLGDRMKSYESRESDRRFLPMVPVYARIDGRGFSSFTRGMERPCNPPPP